MKDFLDGNQQDFLMESLGTPESISERTTPRTSEGELTLLYFFIEERPDSTK